MAEKEIEIKRVSNLLSSSVVKDKGCIVKSYRVSVLCFVIVIVTSG